MALLTSRLDAGDGTGVDGAGAVGLRLRCRAPARPDTWLTLVAVRIDESWSVFSPSPLRTLTPASHANSLEPWSFEWGLHASGDLRVHDMALSREMNGARLRYRLPLDSTQDIPPEATSAHSAYRVRLFTSPQLSEEPEGDTNLGHGVF